MIPHLPAAITLILVLIVVTGCYVLTCWIWPFTNCRACQGTGRRRSWINRKTFRLCRRCRSTGMRLRTGRRIYNFLTRLHGEANR